MKYGNESSWFLLNDYVQREDIQYVCDFFFGIGGFFIYGIIFVIFFQMYIC